MPFDNPTTAGTELEQIERELAGVEETITRLRAEVLPFTRQRTALKKARGLLVLRQIREALYAVPDEPFVTDRIMRSLIEAHPLYRPHDGGIYGFLSLELRLDSDPAYALLSVTTKHLALELIGGILGELPLVIVRNRRASCTCGRG